VPGAEYDRDPERIEFQARLIVAAPQLMALAQALVDAVDEAPEDAPPEARALANQARSVLKGVPDVLASPSSNQPTPSRPMPAQIESRAPQAA
jgi:hypothetical protein